MGQIKQSYKLTVSSLNMMKVINATTDTAKIYAQRFIIRLVEIVNKTEDLSKTITQPVHMTGGASLYGRNSESWVRRTIQMPLSDIMYENTKPNEQSRKAVKAMQRTIIDYTDKNPQTGKPYWTSFPFVGRVTITDGIIYADIEPEIWELVKDFSMGFRTYELQTILKLHSVYSMKLYPYVCKQTDASKLIMTIDDCMKFMGVGNKYKNKPADFIRKCIDPAKEELDKLAPWSFDYEKKYTKTDKKGRPALTAIQFFPKYIENNEKPEKIARKVSPVTAGYITYMSKETLINKFGIEEKNINMYNALFAQASKICDLNQFINELSLELDKKRGTRYEIKNPAGWLIKKLRLKAESEEK